MFSRCFVWLCCCALSVAIFVLVDDCRAAIISEGDVEIVDGDILVAQEADGSLTLTAGTVLEGGNIFIAGQEGLTGKVRVDRGRFIGTGGTFDIGPTGHGTLEIVRGSVVTSLVRSMDVGRSGTGTGEVLVQGRGSQLHVPNASLVLGERGTGALLIEWGATAVSRSAILSAGRSSSTGGEAVATVRGVGSKWEVSEGLQVGGGTLTVEAGGLLTSGGTGGRVEASFVGTYLQPGSIIADGIGTNWQHSGELTLSNGEIAVRSGANVMIDVLEFGGGRVPPGVMKTVKVDGVGSRLKIERLDLDSGTALGEIVVSDGAHLSTGEMDAPLRGTSRAMTVTGLGSEWISDSSTTLDHGAELRILDSASVTHDSFTVDSATVHVAGFGSRWSVNELNIMDSGKLILDQASLVSRNPIVFGSRHRRAANGGLIQGSGLISHFVENSNAGLIRIDPDQRLVIHSLENHEGGANEVAFSLDQDETIRFGGFEVILGENSSLMLDFRGESQGGLEFERQATLGGELVLSALESMETDSSLEILSAPIISGTFDTVPSLGEALGFGVLFGGITYNDDSVVVSLVQQTADFNADGSVDGTDLGTFWNGFGTAGATLSMGDADRDEDVDGGDFLDWQRGFSPIALASATGQTVPEPSSVWLLALAAVALGPTFRAARNREVSHR